MQLILIEIGIERAREGGNEKLRGLGVGGRSPVGPACAAAGGLRRAAGAGERSGAAKLNGKKERSYPIKCSRLPSKHSVVAFMTGAAESFTTRIAAALRTRIAVAVMAGIAAALRTICYSGIGCRPRGFAFAARGASVLAV